MSTDSDAQVIVDTTFAAAQPRAVAADVLYSVIVPEGAEQVTLDLEDLLDRPRAKRGDYVLHDPGSFVAYVNEHAVAAQTAVYADMEHARFTAVLDDHARHAVDAGWGRHRAALTLRPTESWALWLRQDRVWMSQAQFAEHIEEGLPDIVEPAAAEMLEVAQTFQATAKVSFKSSQILHNGQRQFAYEETIESRAGQKGTLTVPQQFTLGVAVFEGQTEGHRVRCRLQHRIQNEALHLRYLIERPRDVLRAGFEAVVGVVEDGTGELVYRGEAPAGR